MSVTDPDLEQTIITASEVNQYFYCPYAWWYGDREAGTERREHLRRGLDYHARVAESAAAPVRRNRLLLIAAVALAVVAMVLRFLGAW